MILRLIHGLHSQKRNGQVAGLAEQGLKEADLAAVLGIVKLKLGRWEIASLGLGEKLLRQRMTEAIDVRGAGAAWQDVEAGGNVFER